MGRTGAGGGGRSGGFSGGRIGGSSSFGGRIGGTSRSMGSSRPVSRPSSSMSSSSRMGSSSGFGSSRPSMPSSRPSSPPRTSTPPPMSGPRPSAPPPMSRPRTSAPPPMSGPRPGWVPPPPPPPPVYNRPSTRVYVHNDYGTRSYGGGTTTVVEEHRTNRGYAVGMAIAMVVTFILIGVFILMLANSSSNQQSTIVREKINSGNAFVSDCVVDDLDWCDNQRKMKKAMESFWRETGVQPYIILTYVTDETDTEAKQQAWAQNLLDTQLSRDSFLWVYFEIPGSDEPGWYAGACGAEAKAVMDDEAISIFNNYVNEYWFTWDENDTDGMFQRIFDKTANTIMRVPTNGWDVLKTMMIGSIIVSLAIVAFCWWMHKRQAEKERAEETERILKAGQNQQTYGTSSDPEMDDLTSKYDNMD